MRGDTSAHSEVKACCFELIGLGQKTDEIFLEGIDIRPEFARGASVNNLSLCNYADFAA